ncbi:hypothetical protein A2U01_0005288, partial [Trifolium medium]|nr:hypothetical protein [Trifolium medium]
MSKRSVVSNVADVLDSVGTQNTVAKVELGSSNVSGSSPSKEQPTRQYIVEVPQSHDAASSSTAANSLWDD